MTTSTLHFPEMIDKLRDEVKKQQYVDISRGVEEQYDVSRVRLTTAVDFLRKEGYEVHYIRATQHGTGKQITLKLLGLPGTSFKDALKHATKLKRE